MREQQPISRYGISISALAVSFSILTGVAAPAALAADSRGRSSVDSGAIRWEDGTKFDDARKWSATAWYNSKYKLTKIKIAPDAWNTITDLRRLQQAPGLRTVKRESVLIISGAAVLVTVGLSTAVYQQATEHRESSDSQLALTYEADFSDDANLAGAAQNLFYGKVTVVKGRHQVTALHRARGALDGFPGAPAHPRTRAPADDSAPGRRRSRAGAEGGALSGPGVSPGRSGRW